MSSPHQHASCGNHPYEPPCPTRREATSGSRRRHTGRVFVLAREGRPLMPCHPARARELLGKERAVVARQVPFTIRLRDRTHSESEAGLVQRGYGHGLRQEAGFPRPRKTG
ncbi:RRXRR domain-containing protein [Streptomyces sp. NPDC050264]|uniref:RRXRR domain-containing protein n=1 Tax=Streptomyces sp. NPDC050264 TaxID=3155038 RepID=UPI00343B7B54